MAIPPLLIPLDTYWRSQPCIIRISYTANIHIVHTLSIVLGCLLGLLQDAQLYDWAHELGVPQADPSRTYKTVVPLYVSIIRPTGQLLRGRCLSITNTRSFSWTFLRGPCHFVRCLRVRRYSLVHRFQKTYARYWT